MKSAKFKDSPLGPIPQDWEVKRLGDIGEPLMCKRVLKYQTSEHGDIPFFKIGTFGGEPDSFISRELYDSLKFRYSFPHKGDCLISAAGTIGRVVVYDGRDAYFQDSNIVWIDNDETIVTNQYLALCYASMKWLSEDGGIISRLYNANLRAQIIACPSIEEQRRIADALGEVDKLIESLDEQIMKKRLIAKGVAHDLLSGKKRLPGFKGAWREVAFKVAFISLGNNTYARECLCGDSANAYDIHYGDVLIRFGAVVDFSSDYIPRLKDGIKPNKDFLQDGDIVFADTAEDEMVGKAVEIRGLGDGRAVSGLHTMACRPCADMFAPRFLGYYLNSDSYRKQLLPLITGSKVSSLSRANFESTILTMPDVIEQQAIADLLSEQDATIAALKAKHEKYARIKEGMMRDLLTGKVRMKGE